MSSMVVSVLNAQCLQLEAVQTVSLMHNLFNHVYAVQEVTVRLGNSVGFARTPLRCRVLHLYAINQIFSSLLSHQVTGSTTLCFRGAMRYQQLALLSQHVPSAPVLALVEVKKFALKAVLNVMKEKVAVVVALCTIMKTMHASNAQRQARQPPCLLLWLWFALF